MPVETATYITQLVPANPTTTDEVGQGDLHLQLIKTVLQSTLPNLNGPVTASPTDLNGVVGLVSFTNGTVTAPVPTGSTTSGGTLVLAGAGSFPNVNLSNVSGVFAVSIGTTTVLTIDGSGNQTVPGWLTAALIKEAGNTLLPSGCIIQWSGAVSAIPAGWQLCDGTSGAPDLRGSFVIGAGNTGFPYVPTNTGGSASVTATTVTSGVHNHGGATGYSGVITPIAYMDSQGTHSHTGSTGQYTLQVADIPSHTHAEQVGQGSGGSAADWSVTTNGNPGGNSGLNTLATGGSGPHGHTISSDGAHVHNITVDGLGPFNLPITTDPGHTHTVTVPTLPPYYALAYIMKS